MNGTSPDVVITLSIITVMVMGVIGFICSIYLMGELFVATPIKELGL